MDENKRPPQPVISWGDDKIARICRQFIAPYTVADGKNFKLHRHSPHDTGPFAKKHKEELLEKLENGVRYLEMLQDKLYADKQCSILIILQAMDAAGKDSTIKHVMGGINPQGCVVTSFKQPTPEEKAHDFLWRCSKALPERGMIGIFNRSYYEEVLALKVHPEWLEAEGITGKHGEKFWEKRYRSIRDFEKHLIENNTHIVKIFLHLSKDEQAKRFLSRLDRQDKNWKFSSSDMKEREYWDQYQQAFEDMISQTASNKAPWTIVPADNKWFARIVVLCAIAEKLASLGLKYPEVDELAAAGFPAIKQQLEQEILSTSSKKRKKHS